MVRFFQKKKKNIDKGLVASESLTDVPPLLQHQHQQKAIISRKPAPVLSSVNNIDHNFQLHENGATVSTLSPPPLLMPKPRRVVTPTRAILGTFENDKTEIEEAGGLNNMAQIEANDRELRAQSLKSQNELVSKVVPVSSSTQQLPVEATSYSQQRHQAPAHEPSSLSTILSDDSSRLYESAQESVSVSDTELSLSKDNDQLADLPDLNLFSTAKKPAIDDGGTLRNSSETSSTTTTATFTRPLSRQPQKSVHSSPNASSSTTTPHLHQSQVNQKIAKEEEQQMLLIELKKQVEWMEKQRMKDREEWTRKEQELLSHRQQMMETLLDTKDQLTFALKYTQQQQQQQQQQQKRQPQDYHPDDASTQYHQELQIQQLQQLQQQQQAQTVLNTVQLSQAKGSGYNRKNSINSIRSSSSTLRQLTTKEEEDAKAIAITNNQSRQSQPASEGDQQDYYHSARQLQDEDSKIDIVAKAAFKRTSGRNNYNASIRSTGSGSTSRKMNTSNIHNSSSKRKGTRPRAISIESGKQYYQQQHYYDYDYYDNDAYSNNETYATERRRPRSNSISNNANSIRIARRAPPIDAFVVSDESPYHYYGPYAIDDIMYHTHHPQQQHLLSVNHYDIPSKPASRSLSKKRTSRPSSRASSLPASSTVNLETRESNYDYNDSILSFAAKDAAAREEEEELYDSGFYAGSRESNYSKHKTQAYGYHRNHQPHVSMIPRIDYYTELPQRQQHSYPQPLHYQTGRNGMHPLLRYPYEF